MNKITYEVELKPFTIPNFVVPIGAAGMKQDGFQISTGIPLKDIPILTLKDMCDEFTKGVLKKAGYSASDKEGIGSY